MILVGAAFAILILAIFYFAFKAESVKKELHLYQGKLTTVTNTSKQHVEMINLLSEAYQKSLLDKLAFVKQTRPDMQNIKCVDAIIMQTVQITNDMLLKNMTVKQAVEHNIGRVSDISHEELQNFFVDQPNAIKQAWNGIHYRQYMSLCEQLLEAIDA
ncbi:hypothetical protein [Catenovulum sediminis]|uniref:DUF2489 domain-containing protein n=1 Tax=Catenovulum sediminis TaxID=1740262 RepID=A0ABV1RG15_9ALTE|nr:hypothetical protein [Catenovulum sediminis]